MQPVYSSYSHSHTFLLAVLTLSSYCRTESSSDQSDLSPRQPAHKTLPACCYIAVFRHTPGVGSAEPLKLPVGVSCAGCFTSPSSMSGLTEPVFQSARVMRSISSSVPRAGRTQKLSLPIIIVIVSSKGLPITLRPDPRVPAGITADA